jgi:hypothetical protein
MSLPLCLHGSSDTHHVNAFRTFSYRYVLPFHPVFRTAFASACWMKSNLLFAGRIALEDTTCPTNRAKSRVGTDAPTSSFPTGAGVLSSLFAVPCSALMRLAGMWQVRFAVPNDSEAGKLSGGAEMPLRQFQLQSHLLL